MRNKLLRAHSVRILTKCNGNGGKIRKSSGMKFKNILIWGWLVALRQCIYING